MAEAGYGTVLELLSAPVDLQGLLRAMYLDQAAYTTRKSIFEDSYEDGRAERNKK